MSRVNLFVLICSAFVLAACANAPTATPVPTGTAVPPLPPAPTQAPSSTPSLTPTLTPTRMPTVTPSPTATPTLHPLTIAAMRQRAYPGSEVTIEETLEPGSNYDRYYASYRSEGLKIYALLTVPRGPKPPTGWPVIVFNHGYIAPNVYRTTERYIAYVDNMARSGYIVFRIDYRGHDRSEGEARGAYGSPDYTVDVLNAVASMQQFPDADPQRIGMWGHSMGGYLTLRAMVISRDIRAGVIWAGVVASYPDLLSRWRRAGPTRTPDPANPSRRWRTSLIEEFGTPEQNPEFWASISSNTYLAEISGPLELHHATGDADVPYEFSETLYAQLLAAGQTAEFHGYEGDNHNIAANFSVAIRSTIEFYDRYLKGAP